MYLFDLAGKRMPLLRAAPRESAAPLRNLFAQGARVVIADITDAAPVASEIGRHRFVAL